MKLVYTRSGTPKGAAMIFLHGNAMGQWMWFDQTEHFGDYDCYNVDLPGHGGSNGIEWESFDHAADLVAQLIAEDIPAKPVYLVGMSLGAMVGLHLLARHPQRIAAAVLTGAFAEAPPRWLVATQGTLLSAALTTQPGKRLFARMLQLPQEALPYYQESVDALSMPSVKRIVRQIGDYSLPEGLGKIDVPVLFVTGDRDVGLNRKSVALLAARIPTANGVLAPGLHHGWNGEDPALFNAMTRAWFEGDPLPDTLIAAV